MKSSIKAGIINYYRKCKARGSPYMRILGIPFYSESQRNAGYERYEPKTKTKTSVDYKKRLKSLEKFLDRLLDDNYKRKKNIFKKIICSGCGVKIENTSNCTFCGMDIRGNFIEFRRSNIPQYEAEVLMEFEDTLDDEFYFVEKNLDKMKMGFSVKNNHVNGLCIALTNLKIIPESIEKLEKLEILILESNQLRIIPESIGNLKSLKILKLGRNLISKLPNSISNLNQLEDLSISSNPIDENTKNQIRFIMEKGISVD